MMSTQKQSLDYFLFKASRRLANASKSLGSSAAAVLAAEDEDVAGGGGGSPAA